MFKSSIIVLVILVFMTTAFAMAATNTIADGGKAGDGTGGISGYNVTGVQYTLDSTNPALIKSVKFTLDDTATSVEASILEGATETFADTCNNTSGNDWLCTYTTPSVTAAGADNLRVISGQ
jgi:hypothetical protein